MLRLRDPSHPILTSLARQLLIATSRLSHSHKLRINQFRRAIAIKSISRLYHHAVQQSYPRHHRLHRQSSRSLDFGIASTRRYGHTIRPPNDHKGRPNLGQEAQDHHHRLTAQRRSVDAVRLATVLSPCEAYVNAERFCLGIHKLTNL